MTKISSSAGENALPEDVPDSEKTKRKESRETRRIQLMEATISVLAKEGYARTTLTRVAREAGVSHGLVNFHFASKERLLAETLGYLAEEYRDNWVRALERAPDGAADRLYALLLADFEPRICTADRLSAWCSFWGEAQSRPLYQDSCGSNDEEYGHVMVSLCATLNEEGGYTSDPTCVARALRVTVEGVWLDLMTMRNPYSREEALRTVLCCAAAFFPRHFSGDGRVLKLTS